MERVDEEDKSRHHGVQHGWQRKEQHQWKRAEDVSPFLSVEGMIGVIDWRSRAVSALLARGRTP
jgi:hypothetical protein